MLKYNGISADHESEIIVSCGSTGAPSNPSGKVFSLAELEWLRDFAVRHDLFVFKDF